MLNNDRENHAFTRHLALGPDGPRVAIKDCIDIAGEVTACGSAALRGRDPAVAHADVVAPLLDRGCRIIGKTNMHELAYGMTGINEVFGTPVNPRWPDRIPGGSSSGSAVAVAAGLCDFAIGTDTGGSVRQPAICCGVFGIKPSYGRISRKGCHPVESSLDCIGIFARSAVVLEQAMALADPTFQAQELARAPRLKRTKASLDDSLGQNLVFGLMEELPDLPYIELPGMAEAFEAGMTIIGAETARAFGHLLESGAQLGADISARIAAAREIGPEAIAKAEHVRDQFSAAVDAALDGADALITPALPTIPPKLEDVTPDTILPLTRFLRPFNLSGHPAIALPCTWGEIPMGLQIIGRKGDDAHLCAIARWMAAILPMIQTEDHP